MLNKTTVTHKAMSFLIFSMWISYYMINIYSNINAWNGCHLAQRDDSIYVRYYGKSEMSTIHGINSEYSFRGTDIVLAKFIFITYLMACL